MEYQLIAPRVPHYSAVEQVLTNRGIPLNEIQHYLNTTESDILDPKLIKNIDRGAKMLISHIAQNDIVHLQIDSDCDGYTSAASFLNYLNCLFPGFVQNNIQRQLRCLMSHDSHSFPVIICLQKLNKIS